MHDNVRFGIVGLGMGMGRARACTQTKGAELVAVCDVWEERGKAAAQEFGVEWISAFHDLLKRADIDVVGVWSPSGMHSSMAIDALQAGKHVCMTKPMDIETRICDQAIHLAEKKGLVLAVDFDSRYLPVSHQIKNALQSGAIGDIVLADLRMKWFRAQTYYDSGKPEGWRSKLVTEGGSMANQAVHYIDLLQWWLGPVKRLVGQRGTFAHEIETEDTGMALLEFESGAIGSMVTTTGSFPNLGTVIEFTGRSGTLVWRDQRVELFQAAQAVDASAHRAASYDSAFAVDAKPVDLKIEDFSYPEDLPSGIMEDMVRAIKEGIPVQCNGREGRKSVALFESVYVSSDSEKWLNIARKADSK